MLRGRFKRLKNALIVDGSHRRGTGEELWTNHAALDTVRLEPKKPKCVARLLVRPFIAVRWDMGEVDTAPLAACFPGYHDDGLSAVGWFWKQGRGVCGFRSLWYLTIRCNGDPDAMGWSTRKGDPPFQVTSKPALGAKKHLCCSSAFGHFVSNRRDVGLGRDWE